MEVVVLALAALTPWAFGGVDPVFEMAIAAGLALLLALWAALAVAAGQLTFVRCPVTLALALIFLVGLIQLMPLPAGTLGWISPGAGQIRGGLLSCRSRTFDTAVDGGGGAPAWPTISVYPHATRAELFRWLGLLVLFAAVRNQIATTGSLWRLSLVMLINGCLLAVFGLAQAFRSPRFIYWVYEASEPFGPFINRNHFAAYMNLCFALGVGLLVWLGPSEQDRKQKYMVKPNALNEQREVLGTLFSPFSVLHSPAQLWTLAGLALMLGATMFSLSRGGFVALFVALIVTMCLRLSWPIRVRRLEVLLVPALLLLGLFAWIGFRPLESRLATLMKIGETTTDTRLSMWADLVNLAPRFWLVGSGYGTLAYVEPLTRRATTFSDPAIFVEHAHNDYLEGFIEGGLLKGGLTVLLVGLIFMAGFRGLRRYSGRTPGALAVGAMTGFLAIALHSAVDFSMTTPAVAILATIVVAHLVALNRADPTRPPADDTVHMNSVRLAAVGGFGIAVTALLLGALLVGHTWESDRVYRWKLAAFQATRKSDPPNREEAIRCLNAAAQIDPDDAELQSDLGQEYLDFGHEEMAIAPKPLTADKQSSLFQEFTLPALEHFALARRDCPLLPRPQMRFAAHAAELSHADSPRQYWDRALKLAPYDPDLWYFAGVQALREGRQDYAWECWRKSLELTPKPLPFADHIQRHRDRLAAMIHAAIPYFGTEPRQQGEMVRDHIVPPDRPDDLVTAATIVDPSLAPDGPARPLLDRALTMLNAEIASGSSPDQHQIADQYHLKALICEKIGDWEAAIRTYGQAVTLDPNKVDWRLEYVKLLKEELRWKEAQHELLRLQRELPHNSPELQIVQDWIQEVEREQKIDVAPK